MNRLKYLLYKILPNPFLDRLFIKKINKTCKKDVNYPNACQISNKHSKTKYCIVRYVRPEGQILSCAIQFIFVYNYIKKKGYIPLLDNEYYYSYQLGKLGENNLWDICFEQSKTIKDVLKENYVMATGNGIEVLYDKKMCLDINGNKEDHWVHAKRNNFRDYYKKVWQYSKNVLVIKDSLRNQFDEEWTNLVQNKKVLGVFMREEFSDDISKGESIRVKQIYNKHPQLPSTREIIDIIKQKNWKYDTIFVSTMFRDTIELFDNSFEDCSVVYFQRERQKYDELCLGNSFNGSHKDVYEKLSNFDVEREQTIAYIKEVMALSRCDYFIAGPSSGAIIALIMNKGEYKDILLLDDYNKSKYY